MLQNRKVDRWLYKKSITIPKKGNATNYTNYRTITLLTHASKILSNIIKNKLKGKIEAWRRPIWVQERERNSRSDLGSEINPRDKTRRKSTNKYNYRFRKSFR